MYYCRIQGGYIKDTCGLHASAEVRGYMQDTCRIHARLIKDKCICIGSRIHEEYMRDTTYFQDTCEIHVCISYCHMYPERYVSEMQDTCGIHARYMYLRG